MFLPATATTATAATTTTPRAHVSPPWPPVWRRAKGSPRARLSGPRRVRMDVRQIFDTKLAHVFTCINSCDTKEEAVLKDIDDLRALVSENRGSLTSFDLARYEKQLQQARKQVRDANRPKRFKFKKPLAIPKNSGQPVRGGGPIAATDVVVEPPVRENQVIFETEKSHNFNAHNLKNSVIVAEVSNSCYLERLEHCKVFINCIQCRVHDSHYTEIYLEGCTTPIIERCSNITFIVLNEITVTDFSHLDKSTASAAFTVRREKRLPPLTKLDAERIMRGQR